MGPAACCVWFGHHSGSVWRSRRSCCQALSIWIETVLAATNLQIFLVWRICHFFMPICIDLPQLSISIITSWYLFLVPWWTEILWYTSVIGMYPRLSCQSVCHVKCQCFEVKDFAVRLHAFTSGYVLSLWCACVTGEPHCGSLGNLCAPCR